MRRRLRDATGSSLIEAAIITPLLLLLTFSIIDFASLFYVYLALENGVSQATRYGVTGNLMDDPNNPGSKLSRDDSMRAVMRQATPTLTLADDAFAFEHMAMGGSAWVGGSGGPGEIQRVTVNYSWTPFDPLFGALLTNGQIALSVDSTMKNESAFQ
jgi:hypothetical protein